MLKSNFKSFAVLFSSVAVVLTICESATAQLRINQSNSIPQGQESEFLEFQRQNDNNLRQMRIMPSCTLGEGLGCNKTGTVVEKIINQSNGTNYQDILLKAVGGEDNYRKFAAFYGNNPQLPNIPYASFWRNEDPSIVDGYRYVLGENVSRNPVSGLRTVTNNFAWSPSSRRREISPRDGLLDLKYAYGRVLFEEAAKVPNLQEQIRSLDLPPDVTKFYVDNISQGLRYLNSGNESGLRQSILRVLSFPYTPGDLNDGWFGRQLVSIPEPIEGVQPLSGSSFLSALPPVGGGDMITGFVPPIFGETFVPAVTSPWWPYAMIPLLPLLLLAFGGDNSSQAVEPPIIVPPDGEVTTEKVPEPSSLTALLMLTLGMGLLNYKQRLCQTKG
ncbi:hypothetical protein VB620_04845 [Nodularia harveyana UHCC-0300]|uniref:PEP-CTERM protein-sorting domain-containing protein n=1 Tax=Nodularia harveyana UHCC-0300 TaxID=2974287 RepID=A0ABU5UBF2_9CYAN|nr:hypothetical protein [Nodularia harveyana]MEA5580668.1 hypothetical protein [Nodularia harveyana UHCC-0300]